MAVKYTLVDPGKGAFHDDHWGIQILEGDLEGYTYQYDTLKFIPSEVEEEGAVLEFNTVTIKDVENTLTDSEKRDILGDILTEIILEQIKDADGTPDTE